MLYTPTAELRDSGEKRFQRVELEVELSVGSAGGVFDSKSIGYAYT